MKTKVMETSVKETDKIIAKLKDYFERRDEIVMAFLFGSWAKRLRHTDSDVDIAVYFKPDFPKFSKMDWRTYNLDRDLRRNLERWLENIVNCSIDIAKIILASEGREIPGSY
ncbi:MAG TPA: nucleotidyltransferase domain-containing protein [Candidatus Latescibacteria bacterium]|nr:nucleotidyltransferase domain-containing protein [Candidatus Latescibacterota bacterium]